MLHTQARALLDLLVERAVPPIHTLSPREARSTYRERRGLTQPDPPAVALCAAMLARAFRARPG